MVSSSVARSRTASRPFAKSTVNLPPLDGMIAPFSRSQFHCTAVQWNWLREKGAVTPSSGGKFTVDFAKARDAVRDLATELLTIEATGDYARAKTLLDRYGKETPEMQAVTATLKDIPVDITPVFPAAGEK